MNDGEAEAAALRELPWNGWKRPSSSSGGNADALRPAPMITTPSRGRLERAGEPQPAAVGHRAQAVGRQVPDDLPDLAFVGLVPELGSTARRRRCVWSSRTSALLRSSSAVSLQRAADVEARDREPLRPRVGEERSDRRVQPLRLAQHDVHQLLLLGAERQLLPQDLDRAGHRRERIADLVGDAGRHLADRRQPLLHARVALELLDVGDVLEREQIAGAAARRLAGASRSSPSSISPRPSPRRYLNSSRRRARCGRAVLDGVRSSCGRQLQHLARPAGRPPTANGSAGDRLGAAVERQDRAAARSVVARPLGRLSMTCWLNACRSAISVDACSSRAPADRRLVGQRAAQQRHGEEPEQVERDRVLRHRPAAAARPARPRATDASRIPAAVRYCADDEADVEHRAQRRHQQAAAAELDDAGRDDRQHVQRREVAGDAAGEVDERRDDQRVDRQLHVDQPAVALDEPQRRRVDDRQRRR